jgi:hypothetical protein
VNKITETKRYIQECISSLRGKNFDVTGTAIRTIDILENEQSNLIQRLNLDAAPPQRQDYESDLAFKTAQGQHFDKKIRAEREDVFSESSHFLETVGFDVFVVV